ncbi:pentapeptide repeat-containing protein [Clostridium paraputrificum]|uniref:pentapeptide repeat-containing protein n=1 Tax=Clostridium paraputrificum TaxID=29363 RepID=UPI000C077CF9
MSNVKGYKVFNPDWTCRGFQYEVGKTFEHDGNIELCGSGFHFCQKASDCFKYYDFNSNNKVAEVEALDLVETEGNKSVTNKIHIVREIPWQELLTIVNTGKDCTGLENTGDCNTGNRNTGNWNTGNWNTGNRNTGDWNTGNWNTGNCNTGNWNTGNCNTGDWNTGDWNTGDCNTVDFSNGVFCTKEDTIKIFDKESNMTLREWRESRARIIIAWNMETTVWIYQSNMTEQEKAQYPSYKTTGGYLKVFTYSEAWKNLWNSITDEEKQEIINIPNFDKNKFKEITGIEI